MYSRGKGQMKLRRVVAGKTHPYVADLLADMLQRRRSGPVVGLRPLAQEDPRRLSQYLHNVERPTLEVQERMRSEWEQHQRRNSGD